MISMVNILVIIAYSFRVALEQIDAEHGVTVPRAENARVANHLLTLEHLEQTPVGALVFERLTACVEFLDCAVLMDALDNPEDYADFEF